MPQIRKKFRKVKRVTDIRKRAQCMKYKSYVPLCEKLKTNNNSLAKALSEEKQECQLLFSQNVALIAEVQDLVSACNKRDAVIINVSKNAKEMLKMLVTVTGYLTNTISMCQEFTASNNTSLYTPYNSAGRRESHRRMSAKSPAKGVVKPMVSGHTITKPTINLSRVTMQDINNASNLSVIPEVVTPPRNQETNSLRSPIPVAARQRRYNTDRTRRMPERLTVSSPRGSEENERRLSKRRSRYSGRMSGKHSRSKSGRLSGGNSTRCSIENFECIRSPTVKLNDVSKFLQNSQSINIRLLTETKTNESDEGSVHAENSDDMNQDNSQISVTIPETSQSDASEETNEKTVENNTQVLRESDVKNEQKKENSTTAQGSSSNYDDPLEGPSWLFNNFQIVPCNINDEKKTDNINVSIDNSTSRSLVVTETSDESDDEKTMNESQTLLSEQESKLDSFSESVEQGNAENDSVSSQDVNNDTGCNTVVSSTQKDTNQTVPKTESEPTQNLVNFVTQRRGYVVEDDEEDEDDFTLMYVRHPRDMQFDMNDLKFPVLEESTLKPIASVEPEPEITTTFRKISQICQIPSISNSIDETVINHSTVNLPLLMNNGYDNKDLTPFKEKPDFTQRKKKGKNIALRYSDDFIDTATTIKKQNSQTNKKTKSVSQDPSTAKVVLQKLDKSDVKSRTPSPEELNSFNSSFNKITSRGGDSSDSENSNVSANSILTLARPRRKRAPRNFQEPSLRTKLRRNC